MRTCHIVAVKGSSSLLPSHHDEKSLLSEENFPNKRKQTVDHDGRNINPEKGGGDASNKLQDGLCGTVVGDRLVREIVESRVLICFFFDKAESWIGDGVEVWGPTRRQLPGAAW